MCFIKKVYSRNIEVSAFTKFVNMEALNITNFSLLKKN